MTREELRALDDRIRRRIEKRGLVGRPITDAERVRFSELKARHSATQVAEDQ